MGVLHGARLLAVKDLRIELRTRDVLSSVGLFALLVVVVASFSFPATGEHRDLVAAGLLWMALLFAMLLGIGRGVGIEHEDACIDALVTSPLPRESIFLGKVLANLTFVGAVEVAILPLTVALLQLAPGRGVWLLLLTVALGTVALVAVATLLSTIAVNTRTREAILPVLVVPVALPVLLAAVQSSAIAFGGGRIGDATSWLLLLVAAAALFLLLGLATFRHLIEE
jgi:heme exporter protein B